MANEIVRIFIILFMLCLPSISCAKPLIHDKLVLMWQVQSNISGKSLSLLKKKGVNLVQTFGFLRMSDKSIKNYLYRMNKMGFGVIMSFTGITVHKTPYGTRLNEDKIAAFVNKWKNYPAVFAWHPFDEPSGKKKMYSPGIQVKAYNYIKSLDPKHPIFISWNGPTTHHFNCCFSPRSFDILGIHAYPYNAETIDFPRSSQNRIIKNLGRYFDESKPLIITLRAFNKTSLIDLASNGLRAQYNFFFRKNRLTRNIGFYGWRLSPNKGISQVPDLMRQFRELKF